MSQEDDADLFRRLGEEAESWRQRAQDAFEFAGDHRLRGDIAGAEQWDRSASEAFARMELARASLSVLPWRGPLPAPRGGALMRVRCALGLAGILLPPRLVKEDLGDAIELLNALAAAGAPAWVLYAKALSTLFWLAINAVREISSALFGKDKPKTSGEK